MKLNLYIIAALAFILVGTLGLASAADTTLGTYKQGDCVNLIQTCDNCTYVNITAVIFPNSSVSINNVAMTKSGTYYNYSYCNTSMNGFYIVTGFGDLDGEDTTWNYLFVINRAGDSISSEQSDIYYIGLIFLVLLMVGTIFIIGKLPNRDAMDEEGTILQVSQLKHLRSVLWIVVWSLGLAITYILSGISANYLYNTAMGDLFFVLWRIMFYVAIIGIPIYIIVIITNLFKSAEMKRMLERGIDIKGTP